MTIDWVGNVTGEIREVVSSDWYWGDDKCRTRCVNRYINKRFIVYRNRRSQMTQGLSLGQNAEKMWSAIQMAHI